MKIWIQKAACAKDCIRKIPENDLLIFLDADAMPWSFVEDHFFQEHSFDVALTLRHLKDVKIDIDHNFSMKVILPFHAVNAGVIMFQSNQKSRDFIDRWIAYLPEIQHPFVEQTALSKICLDADPHAFSQYYKEIVLEDKTKIILLPCSEYNNTDVDTHDNYRVPDGVKYLHFKGYLHNKQHYAAIDELTKSRVFSLKEK